MERTLCPFVHYLNRNLVVKTAIAALVILFYQPLANAQTTVDYTTPGTATFTVPANVYSIQVECIGGGGNGGNVGTTGLAAGGGGGGAYSSSTLSVSPGDMITYTVGGAGLASTFGVGPSVSAAGGSSVAADANTGGQGGLASAGIGTTKYDGGDGANGINGTSGGGGGGAAGTAGAGGTTTTVTGGTGTTPGGNGGDGGVAKSNGNNGATYGGGGGGASKSGGGPTFTGGTGANGLVRITYSVCLPTTQPSSGSVGTLTTSTADLSWTSGDGDAGEIVFIKQGSAIGTDPANGTAYTANASFGSGSQIGATGAYAVYSGSGGAVTVTGLSLGTTYYYAVYTYNSAGPCYLTPTSVSGSFTTTTCVAPSTQASSVTVQCPQSSTLNLEFTRGDGDRAIVVGRAGSDVDMDPVYNTSYTGNTAFGSGSQIGTGNYVVYDGNDAGTVSLTISNLTPGETYYFRVYEYYASPNCYGVPVGVNLATTGGVYVSSTTVQNTNDVVQGTLDADIVQLNIVTSGDLNTAVILNSITFSTTGTTNTNDIANAKIYYTGSSSTFSSETQFGQTFTTFGSNTALDTFALLTGNNYFWIAYDVDASATGGNVLDAVVSSINITEGGSSSDQIPTITAPAGSRTILTPATLTYCGGTIPLAVGAGSGCQHSCSQGEFLSSISGLPVQSFSGWSCNSTCQDQYSYNDKFFDNVYVVTEGSNYTMSINMSTWFSLEYDWAIWVDWNQDGVFTNASPERYPTSGAIDEWTSQTISVPSPVSSGRHRARLWIQEFSYPPTDPCRTSRGPLTTSIGYIVDFNIIVSDGSLPDLDPAGSSGTACATTAPAATSIIEYTVGDTPSQLTATGTNLLWYTSSTGGTGSATAPTPSTASAGTQMYYVSQNNGSCEGPRTQIAVIVSATTLTAPVAAANQPTCLSPSSASIDISGLPSGSWTLNPGSIAGSGTTHNISPVSVGSYAYTYTDASGCVSPVSNTATINSPTATGGTQGVWIGGYSTDWNDPANWCAVIPDATTDVTIPSSASYMPLISSTVTPGICRDLTINASGSLSLSAGSLSLYGNIVNNGTYNQTGGKLIVTGSGPQTFGGSTSGLTVHDLMMNNASGLTLTNGSLTVDSSMDLTSGNITTGSYEVIMSGNVGDEIINHSSASYVNGNLRRSVSGTGLYEFPVGDATNYQHIDLNLNALTGVSNILGYFNNTAPAAMGSSITEGATTYTSVVTDGFWTITPDAAPTGGTYDMQVYPVGFTGDALVKATSGMNNWNWWGSTKVSNVYRTGYTDFSDVTLAVSGSALSLDPLNNRSSNSNESSKVSVFAVDFQNSIQQNEPLNLKIQSLKSSTSHIKVVDLSGRAVFDQQFPLNDGMNEVTIKTANWSIGTYVLTVVGDGNVVVRKFVVN